jgi:simple sugar transport system ATP-binding protein
MPLARLKLTNISKSYAGVLANNQVNLTILPHEIQALLGENGAGKSTLMKIIYGLVRPDAGEIEWSGQQVNISSPEKARSLGINMVFQHFSLFETLTVTENIALAQPKTEKWDLTRLAKKIRELSQQYGLSVDPQRRVHSLSVGERQRVEIIRCLSVTTKLLILDEPTAVLTPGETEKLFAILRQIASSGCSILISSHKLQEVRSLCSYATVLRNGEVVAQCNPHLETSASLARLMIGADVPVSKGRKNHSVGSVCLRVKDLCLEPEHPFGTPLQHISFELYAGEIVGIAGVAGNGQSELLAALSGQTLSPKAYMMQLGEMPIGHHGVVKRRCMGLAYTPEERLEKGAVPNLNLLENALLTGYTQGLVRRGYVRQARLNAWTQRICEAFNVKQAGLDSPAGTLSGGNLQKFIMGREILQHPLVLIAAHPSWGVDINATASIHEALIELRDAGTAILVISEDLDELFSLCDRIGAIYKGELSPLKPIQSTSRDEIGCQMGGVMRMGGQGDKGTRGQGDKESSFNPKSKI